MSVPDQIGRYQVQRRLGSGGFATVWLAEDDVLDAFVAIKVLADNWADQLDVRARFVEEARILRRADSDWLVRVLDVGELPDGRPFVVLSYADRGSLADRLAPGPLPVELSCQIGAEIARGVAVLHGIGIIHRDVKPSNVLFGRDGSGRERVLIADLGLAKAVAHASGFTVAAGSPGYMAPEQASPGRGIDVRADVYALGAVLYHMLTGAPPASRPVPAPSTRRAGVPAELDRIVLRALQDEPERRWPSAAALADALALAGSSTVALAGSPAAALGGPPTVALAGSPAGPRVAGAAPVTRPIQLPARPVSRGWPRRAAVAALAVLLLAGVGVASVADSAPGGSGSRVRLADASQTVSVEVPVEWAGQRQDAGWNPARLGLQPERAPGLAVAPDLAAWREPGIATPGVFVGASQHLRGTTPIPLDHGTCTQQPDREYRSGPFVGTIRRWVRCANTAVSFSEAVLVDSGLGTSGLGTSGVDGSGARYGVFVQVKQAGEIDHTDWIMASVRLRSG